MAETTSATVTSQSMMTAADRYSAGRNAYTTGKSIQSLDISGMWNIDCLYGFIDAMADDIRKIKTAKG